MADSFLPGTGKFFQLHTQVCEPLIPPELLQDALSAPIDTKTNKTFQSPIGGGGGDGFVPVFDSYFNLTNTVVQILTSPQMAAFESMGSTVPDRPRPATSCTDAPRPQLQNAKECAVLAEVPNNGFSGIYPLAPTVSATHSIGSFYDFAKGYTY
jgi:hypothetical protein